MTRYGPKAQAIAATYGAVTGLLLVAAVVAAENAARRRTGRLRRPATVPLSAPRCLRP